MSVKIAQVLSNTSAFVRISLRTTGMALLVLALGGAALAQEQNQTQGPEQQARRHPRHSHLYIGTMVQWYNPVQPTRAAWAAQRSR